LAAAGCSSPAPESASPASLPNDQADRIDPLLEAGDAARAAGDFETALSRYQAATAINPRSLKAWLGIAAAELAEQHNEAAAEAYRSAQIVDDDNAEAAYGLGQIALRAGRAADAAAEFEHGLKSHGDDPRLNNGAAVAYALEGEYDRARHYYDVALAAAPDNPSLRNNYGLLQLQTGDLDGALAAFSLLVQAYPTNNRYRMNLAMVYLALGKTSDALANTPGLTEDQLRHVLAAFYHAKPAPAVALSNSPAAMAPSPQIASAARQRDETADATASKGPVGAPGATPVSTPQIPPSPEINPSAGAASSTASSAQQPARPTNTGSATGVYKIQVGSVRSGSDAEQQWQRLQERQQDILGDLSPMISRADLGARGVFYRIQAGPFADAVDAGRRCDELRGRSLGCIVVRP
jgi:Tfp pilus assembly protein PilF